jgi:uncharacterized integral membrane protein
MMLRKIVNILVVLPLAILFVAFAVANRHVVTLSFDPFNSADPALGVKLPLFAVIIVVAMFGVLAGGIATWFGQHKWRKAARENEAEAWQARTELAELRARQAAPAPTAQAPVLAPGSPYPAIGRDKHGATL